MAGNSKELHRLQFHNPVFKDGMNVTVRKGDKWTHQVLPGSTVVLKKTDGDDLGEAYIAGVMYLPLRLIPPAVLKLEHDPKCRNPKGLLAVLRSVYGEDVNENTACTVLFFNDPEALKTPGKRPITSDEEKAKDAERREAEREAAAAETGSEDGGEGKDETPTGGEGDGKTPD